MATVCKPDHARAVAIVWIGERAADEGVGEQSERDDGGQFADVGWKGLGAG
jgi:hypothetical protein